MHGYLGKGVQTPMAQGRSTKIISMIKRIRTSRFSIKKNISRAVYREAGREKNAILVNLNDRDPSKTTTPAGSFRL